MELLIGGVVINVIMLIIVVIIAILAFVSWHNVRTCEDNQSPYCYSIYCPGQTQSSTPCHGFAARPGPRANTFYCSNAPTQLVDNNGNPT